MTDQKETKKTQKLQDDLHAENIADEQSKTESGDTEKPSIEAPDDEKNGYKDAGLPEPTRYKDWEVKGRCSDF